MSLIEETVDPETWRSAGGSVGTYELANGRLRIRQHPEQHLLIVHLLDQILPRDPAMKYLYQRLIGERP